MKQALESQRSIPVLTAAAALWIILSSLMVLLAWLLSVAGALSSVGYVLGGTAALGGGVFAWRRNRHVIRLSWRATSPQRLRRLFQSPLATVYLVLTSLALIGGALYAPSNYDALTYRLPRLLHYLANGKWHWISTPNLRMNYSSLGFEWLMAPLLALSNSDRLLFLVNGVSQLLLPSLTFACFCALGVRASAARLWMWLLPTGYCFLLQAGSIGNDSFAAVYLMAAIVFARRAVTEQRVGWAWLSLLAAGLTTGAKASNLPLVLPCLVALVPACGLLMRTPTRTAVVGTVALLISFAPVAALNWKHTGDWTGDPDNSGKKKLESPLAALCGNTLLVGFNNLQPPVMPVASSVNASLERLMSEPALQRLKDSFPQFGLRTYELANEEGAGLGLGLSLVVAVGVIAGLCRYPRRHGRRVERFGCSVCLAGLVALLAYMLKMGSESAARLLAAYYPLLIAATLLLPAASALAKRRWFRDLAVLAALSALPALILTPSRPLWPAQTVLARLQEWRPQSRAINRAAGVYAVYAQRPFAFVPLLDYLPPATRVVGWVGSTDDPQTSLWRPYGSRRVDDLVAAEINSPAHLPDTLVIQPDGLKHLFAMQTDELLRRGGYQILGQEELLLSLSRGPQPWLVLGRNPDQSAARPPPPVPARSAPGRPPPPS